MASERRRTKGSGTVWQADSGNWVARATIAGRRRSATCGTKREAEAALRKMLVDADRGLLVREDKLTVGEYLEVWSRDIAPVRLRVETLKSYQLIIRVHLLPVLANIKLSQLNRAHLRSLYASLGSKGLKPSTVHRVHAVLSSALGDALKDELIVRDVCRGMDLPSAPKPEMQCLDASQCKALIAASKGTFYEALWTLLLYGGMRIGELLALRWSDLDLNRGTIRITRNLTRSKSFGEPKTSRGRRTITLPSPALDALRVHKARQAEQRLAAVDWTDLDLMFCTGVEGHSKTSTTAPGSPLTQRCVQDSFKRLLVRAGLPRVRLHDLRHSAISLMLSSGVPITTASQRAGHSRVSTTLDIYAHSMPSADREAANALAALLG